MQAFWKGHPRTRSQGRPPRGAESGSENRGERRRLGGTGAHGHQPPKNPRPAARMRCPHRQPAPLPPGPPHPTAQRPSPAPPPRRPVRAARERVVLPGALIGQPRRRSQNAAHGASLKRDHDGGGAGPPRSDRSAGERGQSSDGERAAPRASIHGLPGAAPTSPPSGPPGPSRAAEGRRRYGAGVSILLSCRVPFLGLRLPCLCGWGNRVIWAAVSTRICPQPGYRAGGGRWALRVPLD